MNPCTRLLRTIVRLIALVVFLLASLLSSYADEGHTSDDAFWQSAAALLPGFTGTPSPPGSSADQGSWTGILPWPHVPVSAASLPNGKLLTYSGQERLNWPGSATRTQWSLYDPVTDTFDEEVYYAHEMFCAHLVMRTDGIVQTMGGRYTVMDSSTFDWRSNQWQRVADMNSRRWYTTSVALPDGDVFTVAGSGGPNTAERYDKDNDSWSLLGGIDWAPVSNATGFESNWWPYLWVAPDGRLFHFGPTEAMHWVSTTGSGSRTSIGISVPGNHYPKHAAVTMYDSGKILVAGGASSTGGGSTNVCYTVDLNTSPPTVALASSMTHPRRFASAVVLPNGEVLVVGGSTTGQKFSDNGAVLTPELWDPLTDTWRALADHAVPRNYHSTGILLSDGRVFSGGGGYGTGGDPSWNHDDAEIFTPPSLFENDGTPRTRPTISTAPETITPGSTFAVSGSANIRKFSLIRLMATTHGLSTDQRYLSLPFSESSPGEYSLIAHPNPNVMVPGYWMLFAINADGSYSTSTILHCTEASVDPHDTTTVVNGLRGFYSDGKTTSDPKFSRVDPVVDFTWDLGSPNTAEVGDNSFSVNWAGFVVPEHTETYTFYTNSDDGIRLWLDGEMLIDNWTDHGPTEDTTNITLVAGQAYPITIHYYESTGGATAQLSWSSPSTPKAIIPTTSLFTNPPVEALAPDLGSAAVAADNLFELFIDGALVAIGTNWQDLYHSNFPVTPATTIAIRACDTGDVAGLIGEFEINGENIVTDGSWKVATTVPTGWQDPGFDDSAWSPATEHADNGSGPWGTTVQGLPANAKWIWSADNTADNEVYFRFTSGIPQITPLGNQLGVVGNPPSLSVTSTAPSGAILTFTESGLPPGISLDPATGDLTGTFTQQGVFPNVTFTVTDQFARSTSTTFEWVVKLPGQGSGTILHEWWTGLPGVDLTILTSSPNYPYYPDGAAQRTSFDAPANLDEEFGQRLRGYLHVPVTGDYTFWIASDDTGSLLLSTDSTSAQASEIASVPIATAPQQWDANPSQESAPVTLQGGQTYYLEALSKENTGNDHLSVAWQGPGDLGPTIIDGIHLSPFVPNQGPTLTALPDRSDSVGTTVSLAPVAEDPETDPLTFVISGLPTGLGYDPDTGLISGDLTAAGPFSVTVSVSDGIYSDDDTFTWTVNPALVVDPLVTAPTQNGTSLTVTATTTGGTNPSYVWNFGDGAGDTLPSSSPSASHTYAAPGRYLISLSITDQNGTVLSTSTHQNITPPLTATAPSVSQSVLYEARSGSNDRVWNVNPDNETVAIHDAITHLKVAELAVPGKPVALALDQSGLVLAVSKSAATVRWIDPVTLTTTATLSLPRASRPHGIVYDAASDSAYLALEATGEVVRLDNATRTVTATVGVGASPRHLSLTADGATLLVSRFITPPVPGESTLTPNLTGTGGEVIPVATATFTTGTTILLASSVEPDSGGGARGLPNYLGVPAISPAGDMAWVPSKQDNIERGGLREGNDLDHDSTVRAISSRIDLGTLTEDHAARVDHDDAAVPSAALFGPQGLYLFVALEGSREVAVIEAYGENELFRFDTGRAPQGLVLSADGNTLYVHNFLSRTVTAHDLTALLTQGIESVPLIATYATVATESLTPQVLIGKQLFYDANDDRLSRADYMSCAACHNDGDHDGRVWDLGGFGEGLRNTIDLRGRAGTAHGRLHWSANFDEVQDFEGQIINLSEGTGLIETGSPHPPLGTPNGGRSADLDALAAYLGSLDTFLDSPHRQADGSRTAAAVAGEQVFYAKNCASCHSGSEFTDSPAFQTHDIGTLKPSSGQRLGGPLTALDTPTLRSVWSGAPYLHDGSAATLGEALDAHQGITLTTGERNELVSYLQEIEGADLNPGFDNIAPTVMLAGPAGTVTDAFTILINLSEPVIGLELSDVYINNGVGSDFSGSGTLYRLTVTPTQNGTVTAIVPDLFMTDAAGNGNVVSNQFSVQSDITIPQATLLSTVNEATGPFVLGVTFTEPINGLEHLDFRVTNGFSTVLQGFGQGYALFVTPDGNGDVEVYLPANRVSDAAGNGNPMSNLEIIPLPASESLEGTSSTSENVTGESSGSGGGTTTGAPAQPALSIKSRTETTLVAEWTSVPGASYQLEHTPDFALWTPEPAQLGDGLPMTSTLDLPSLGSPPALYLRLRVDFPE